MFDQVRNGPIATVTCPSGTPLRVGSCSSVQCTYKVSYNTLPALGEWWQHGLSPESHALGCTCHTARCQPCVSGTTCLTCIPCISCIRPMQPDAMLTLKSE